MCMFLSYPKRGFESNVIHLFSENKNDITTDTEVK